MIPSSYLKRRELGNILFLLPAILLFVLMVVWPFLNGIRYSFTDWDGFSQQYSFVGFRNYWKVLQDPSLRKPLVNSVYYTVLTVIGNNIFGLLAALMLRANSRTNRILRTLLFMPFVISLVLTGFIWSYIYSDVFYAYFGIKSLLGNPNTVMLGIVIMGMWRDVGYSMLIYIAALQNVPEMYYEAAKIDGAGAFRRFFSITLPMISSAITVNVTLFLGWGLKVFDYPMAATGGGPGRASETLALSVYNYTFPYNKAGYGQAAAVVMMIGIFIITGVVTSLLRKREVEV